MDVCPSTSFSGRVSCLHGFANRVPAAYITADRDGHDQYEFYSAG